MGWTFTNGYTGGGVRNYLDRQIQFETETTRQDILRSALVEMSRYYAAVRTTNKSTGEVSIWALIALVKFSPKAKDGMRLGWKATDESMEIGRAHV